MKGWVENRKLTGEWGADLGKGRVEGNKNDQDKIRTCSNFHRLITLYETHVLIERKSMLRQ